MNKPLTEKEKLLMMLTDIYDQLEELESVLEASFSDLRCSLNKEEHSKLTIPLQKLSMLENKIDSEIVNPISTGELTDIPVHQTGKSLKLELGF
jgi:hypothetical protein